MSAASSGTSYDKVEKMRKAPVADAYAFITRLISDPLSSAYTPEVTRSLTVSTPRRTLTGPLEPFADAVAANGAAVVATSSPAGVQQTSDKPPPAGAGGGGGGEVGSGVGACAAGAA